MTATTDILPFATGGGANVVDQATYAADAATGTGFSAGLAPSARLNKVWRQSSFVAAGLANWIVSKNINVPDDGNISNFVAHFEAALEATILAYGGRVAQTGATTYYVATTGNDSTGTGAVGAPWATIQKAINYITANVDLAGYNAKIKVSDGTYTAGANFSVPTSGGGLITLEGNTTTPTNCIISTTSADAILVQNGLTVNIGGFSVRTTTSGMGIHAQNYGTAILSGNMDFGACAQNHVYANLSGIVELNANYSVSGAAGNHLQSNSGTINTGTALTATCTGGALGFTTVATATNLGLVQASGLTFSGWGSITGARYSATANAAINTGGGGASYFPGNSSGSTSSGGQYV